MLKQDYNFHPSKADKHFPELHVIHNIHEAVAYMRTPNGSFYKLKDAKNGASTRDELEEHFCDLIIWRYDDLKQFEDINGIVYA